MKSVQIANGYRAALLRRFWGFRREVFPNDSESFDRPLSSAADRVLSATVHGGIFPWQSVRRSSAAVSMSNLQTAGGPAAVA